MIKNALERTTVLKGVLCFAWLFRIIQKDLHHRAIHSYLSYRIGRVLALLDSLILFAGGTSKEQKKYPLSVVAEQKIKSFATQVFELQKKHVQGTNPRYEQACVFIDVMGYILCDVQTYSIACQKNYAFQKILQYSIELHEKAISVLDEATQVKLAQNGWQYHLAIADSLPEQ